MNKFYGPFYMDENGIWHWQTSCPDFPQKANPKVMVSSNYPDKIVLCRHCVKIDEKSAGSSAIKLKK